MDETSNATLQAYADGINDCVTGTSFLKKKTTGMLLPPEFYAFGMSDLSEWRPWHPVDSIAFLKYKNYFMTWNWMNDLARESLRQKDPELASLLEELNPFKSEDMFDHTYTIDDEDLKEHGQFS